jgi:hypothetical protein
MNLLLVLLVTEVAGQKKWQHHSGSGEREENSDEVCSNHISSYVAKNYPQSRGFRLKDCEHNMFAVFRFGEHKQIV